MFVLGLSSDLQNIVCTTYGTKCIPLVDPNCFQKAVQFLKWWSGTEIRKNLCENEISARMQESRTENRYS